MTLASGQSEVAVLGEKRFDTMTCLGEVVQKTQRQHFETCIFSPAMFGTQIRYS